PDPPVCKEYFIASCIKEDECQNQIGSLFRVFNKKKDGSQGLQLKFSVNFYHTTSSVLVNGNRVEIFENELFKPICGAIKASCLKLSVINEQIAQVLSSTEKVEAAGTVRAIDNVVSNNMDIENLPEQLTQESTESSQDNPTTHDITHDNSNVNITLCPSCEQTAGDQTIACEECGEWYHFSCTGLNNKSADAIPSDVPFICLACNDNLLYAPSDNEQHNLTTDSVHQSVSEPVTISKYSPEMQNSGDSSVISEQTVSYSQLNTSKMENDASYRQTEKRSVDSSTSCENPNKKSKSKKSTNNENSKKSLNTEEKETLLAQKFYITSLENRINDLQNTVSVLNGIKDLNVQSPQNESQKCTGTGTIPILNHEMSGEYTLRTMENKLNLFEANIMNALNLQNQLTLQNFMNMQNHLSIMSMQSQISSVQSQMQNVWGPQLQRYSNPMPFINPGLQQPMGIHPHPASVIYPITTVRHPSFIPTHMTVPPPPYLPHVLQTGAPVSGAAVPAAYVPMPPDARILQQPNMTMPPHLIRPQQRTDTFAQRPPTSQTQMQFQPGSGVQQIQPTSAQARVSGQMNRTKQLVGEGSEQTVALDDELVSDGVSYLCEASGQDKESQLAMKVQKTTVIKEHDNNVLENLVSDCGSKNIPEEDCQNKAISNTSKDTENLNLNVHDMAHSGDLNAKKHFLEIPSPKEIPPDVDRLNAVVCLVQDRT
ncbi:MAG: hypothetical protein N0E59_20925, partial [Candidatus Thiodiazotropha taylori]|nr:hypothetical protein [Candidatus Thiodiazotropha taylori]MCW4285583.1 hypothetical protein [Candidatus Thiodiazotropha taylori]